MRTTSLIILFLAAGLSACEGDRGAREAFRDGRFRAAHESFVRLSERDGEGASPELLYNRALAALRAGEVRDAEGSAALVMAKLREEAPTHQLARFIRGNAAYVLCEMAEEQADTPEAEPFAFDVAIAYGEAALRHWRDATMTRVDWPEARRNVERALAKVASLREKKSRAEKRRTDPNPDPREKPRPEPPDTPTKTEEEAAAESMLEELSPEEVAGLFEKLRKKEREKRDVRRRERGKRSTEVEKDW